MYIYLQKINSPMCIYNSMYRKSVSMQKQIYVLIFIHAFIHIYIYVYIVFAVCIYIFFNISEHIPVKRRETINDRAAGQHDCHPLTINYENTWRAMLLKVAASLYVTPSWLHQQQKLVLPARHRAACEHMVSWCQEMPVASLRAV